LTGSKDIEKWVCKLAQVVFKMHRAGLSYTEIDDVIREMHKRLSVMGYTEQWMKKYNPEGLKYIN